ncbi:MAG: cysteine-rich KTR domain-containing protein [Lachnospiraceae bacterium]|nr:cysteine-rich KTR domain-containing protein [Lachnospiraceae bacterium]
MRDTRKWVFCPMCGGKTRLQLLETTELKDFPLFCPKCKQEMLIRAVNYKVVLCGKQESQNLG